MDSSHSKTNILKRNIITYQKYYFEIEYHFISSTFPIHCDFYTIFYCWHITSFCNW